ncbi:MAG TPA: hypothetical protein VE268_03365 [Herpetosiphonaceae bacterium]|nr:hypothetical protein [Herpetosiphonaceae bacterium]
MRIVLIIVLGLLLVACGNATVPAGPISDSNVTTTPALEITPAVTAAPTAEITPGTTLTATGASAVASPVAGSVEAKVAQALSKKTGVDTSKLVLTAKDALDWPDSALGCPAPGMMYSQIVTPGFKLVYSDGAKTYEVHTDRSGNRAVLCQNKQSVELSGSSG